MARTENFRSSFDPHGLCEWNDIEPELRLAPSVDVFQKKILSMIRALQILSSDFMTQQAYLFILNLELV